MIRLVQFRVFQSYCNAQVKRYRSKLCDLLGGDLHDNDGINAAANRCICKANANHGILHFTAHLCGENGLLRFYQ